ncbi:MAG TPA: fibronectin type III domain-containing protein [Candidatus Lokiarchaeia archaeon]|nr:fibronectin type III domain-containing protein [Candidatus Lokiarchaeia archaeon]
MNINLSWSYVNGAEGYYIYFSQYPINNSNIKNLTASAETIAPRTNFPYFLPVNGTYYFAVVANNSNGMSPPSNCQSVRVIRYPPKAPTLSVISPNPNKLGNVTLSWTSVPFVQFYVVYESNSSINDANITKYQYHKNWWGVLGTSITDIEPNGTYFYVVVASNNTGSSACSNCRSVTVAAPPTTVPHLFVINPNPSPFQNISISWSKSNNSLGYYVYQSNSNITSANIHNLKWIAKVDAPTTTCTVQDPANGTYYYAIVAYNGGGNSTPSNCQSVVVAIIPIPMDKYIGVVPNNSFLFMDTLNGNVEIFPGVSNGLYDMVLTVDNTTDLGTTARIEYHCVYSNATNNSVFTMYESEIVGASNTTVTSANLWIINKNIANKTYFFDENYSGFFYLINSTWANNGVLATLFESINNGVMDASGLFLRVSTFPLPSTPQNLNVSTGVGRVMLAWQVPVGNGGSPIVGYKIYRGTSPGNEVLWATIGNITRFTDTNVLGGQTYYYTVSTFNSANEGPKTNETAVEAYILPSAPLHLQATSGIDQLVLTWQASASNGGLPITGYEIYRSTAPGNETLLMTVGNVTTYTDRNVTNGQTYYYTVCAVTSAGDGAQATETSATPTAGSMLLAIIIGIVVAGVEVTLIVTIGARMRKIRKFQSQKSRGSSKNPS